MTQPTIKMNRLYNQVIYSFSWGHKIFLGLGLIPQFLYFFTRWERFRTVLPYLAIFSRWKPILYYPKPSGNTNIHAKSYSRGQKS